MSGRTKVLPGDRTRDHTDSRGERNGNAKLTEPEVRRIRYLWATGSWTQPELAAQFGVTRYAISKIVQHHRWRHI